MCSEKINRPLGPRRGEVTTMGSSLIAQSMKHAVGNNESSENLELYRSSGVSPPWWGTFSQAVNMLFIYMPTFYERLARLLF